MACIQDGRYMKVAAAGKQQIRKENQGQGNAKEKRRRSAVPALVASHPCTVRSGVKTESFKVSGCSLVSHWKCFL